MLNFLSQNHELITAFSALFISIVSIGISVWQLKVQRIHNYKSVEPSGAITFGDHEKTIHVRVYNFGIGPMIINKAKFYTDNKTSNSLLDFLPKKLPIIDFNENIEGKTIYPGGRITLIELTIENLTDKEKISLRHILGNISGVIKYRDTYDKNSFVTERSFKWFTKLSQDDLIELEKKLEKADSKKINTSANNA